MSLLVCNLLIVVTSLYRLLRTPPPVVEIGKSPIIPNLSTRKASGSEPPNIGTSGTGGRERATTREDDESETGRGGHGSGSNDIGIDSYPKTATPSTSSTGIELTELYESDLSFA